jgi:hypothetical protein
MPAGRLGLVRLDAEELYPHEAVEVTICTFALGETS